MEREASTEVAMFIPSNNPSEDYEPLIEKYFPEYFDKLMEVKSSNEELYIRISEMFVRSIYHRNHVRRHHFGHFGEPMERTAINLLNGYLLRQEES